MFKLLLAIHLVLAVFAIGPLVHAATTAARGIRTGDATATASSARVLRIYSYASVLVIAAGFALMSQKVGGQQVAEFGDTWVWLSLVLWLVAMALVLAVTAPALTKAGNQSGAAQPGASLTGRVAGSGGLVAVIFVVIVVLMTYRPGG